MYSLSKEADELKQIIEKKMRCAYIEKHIQKPFIDDNKLFMLCYLYKEIDIPKSLKQRYITTIMLVQIALDTHELIPSNDQDEMEETEKQLSVLAGDYYSGLYYLLLSEIEDVDMMRILASAIQKINEQKMKLFYEDVASLEEFLTTIKSIESLLLSEVADSMDETHYLKPIMTEYLFIHKLIKEKEFIHKGKNSYIEGYVRNHYSSIDDNQILSIIDQEIESSKEQLDELLVQLPYQLMMFKNAMRSKLGLSYNKTVAEEG